MPEEVQIEKENTALMETGLEFFVIECDTKGECTASAHIHNAIEILYITKGQFLIYINGDRHIARCGDLVLLYSNTIHSIFLDSREAGAYSVLKLKPSVLLDMIPGKQGLVYLLPFTLYRENQTYIYPCQEVCSLGLDAVLQEMLCHLSNPQYASVLTLKANAIRICALLLNTIRQQTQLAAEDVSFSSLQRIYEAMIYVNSYFALDISARSCAAEMAMSYTYFSRMFKKIVGKSFSAYLTETRIKNAERELLLTEKSVTEICFQCGFNDVSYFISQYKALRGISPYQFRKQNEAK